MIDVSCGLILNEQEHILAAQRSASMRLPLKWEFPGGKIETGESAENCLIRELYEELRITVEIVEAMPVNLYDGGDQVIRLFPFQCRIVSGEVTLTEHAAFLWLPANELQRLDWAAADIPVLEEYLLTSRKRGQI